MVTTHTSEYSEDSTTPATTREWRHNVLSVVPLYGAHNLPPPPQRSGAAGGKVLLKTTHVVPGRRHIAAVVQESFHPEFHMGQRVLAAVRKCSSWREYALFDARKTSLLPLPPGTKPEDALVIAAVGADALFAARVAGGEALAEGSPDDAEAVSRGPKVLVTGAHTGQGLLALQALRLDGVEEVRALVSEGGERAVRLVREVGKPTRMFEQAEEMRDQGEVDVVVCCGGVEGMWVVRRGGRVLIVGDAEVEEEEEVLEVAEERGLRVHKVEGKEGDAEAIDTLLRWTWEEKLTVLPDVRKAEFTELPAVVKRAEEEKGRVGALVIELMDKRTQG